MAVAASLWVRYTETDSEGPKIIQCEVARQGDKHRIKPDTPTHPEDIFSLHALPVLIDIMRTGGQDDGVLRIPEINVTIGDITIESCTRIKGEISTLVLMTRGAHFEGLLQPDHFALPLRRRVATDHAAEIYEQIIMPTVDLAGAVRQDSELAKSQRVGQQLSKLQKRVARAAQKALAIRVFIQSCEAILPKVDQAKPALSKTKNAVASAAPTDATCLLNLSRSSTLERWHVQNFSISGMNLHHKLLFLKPQTVDAVFGEELQGALEASLPQIVTARPNGSIALLHNGPGYLIDGCSFVSGGGDNDLTASIKFDRFYGLPEFVKDLGPWPSEIPEGRADNPNSLLHQSETAIGLCSQCLTEITHDMISEKVIDGFDEQIRFVARVLSSNLALE